MNRDDALAAAIGHWLALADEALASARDDVAGGRVHSAVNRAYYACFYAATAYLHQSGRQFGKHTAVRAAAQRD